MAIEVELRGTYFGNAPLHSLCREICKIAFSSKISMIPIRYHWEKIKEKGGHFEMKNACKIKKKILILTLPRILFLKMPITCMFSIMLCKVTNKYIIIFCIGLHCIQETFF
jgi:hypothetical protein